MSAYTREQVLRLIEENRGPEGLDLSGRDLVEIDLSGVDLHGAILARADLSEADLRRANLEGANLSWAVLQEADLRWADLRVANLHRADLKMAKLRWADLSGAEIEGADFSGADLSEVTMAGVKRGKPGHLPGFLLRLKPRFARVKATLGSAIALIALIYLWGWLYRAFYLEAFGLPWTSILTLLSADYPIYGLQVIGVSLSFLSMLVLFLLYILLMMGVFLLMPLASIFYLGDRLPPRLGSSKVRRGMIIYALFLAYFAILCMIFSPVIRPLWGWLMDKGLFAKEGLRVFRLLLADLPTSGRVLFLFSLALLSIPPIWILYRLICQGLSRAEALPFLQSHFPWLERVLASLKEARLFRPAHPFSLRERYLGLFWTIFIVVTLPAFLTQAGKLHAQADMCDGGSLPQIALYSKELTPPSSYEKIPDHPQYCLRLLLAKDDRYYVFYPDETREVEGKMKPKVYEVPADDVLVVRQETKTCWTCLDTLSGERPPVIISSLVTVTPTPTAAPTATPSPPTATSVPTSTPQPSPTFTPGPPPTPSTPSPTRTPGGDDYEPDNAARQANLIALGETQTHSFCPDDDIDLVKFPVKERHWYHVYTHDLAMGVDTMISVGLEPTIAIFCDPSNCANDDIAPTNLASEVVFQAAADGTALVTIDNRYQHGPDKTYQITVKESPLPPTPTPTITPTPTPGKDVFEPNNDFSTAWPIDSGKTYRAYIWSATDKDYYRIDVHVLDEITIKLSDIPDGTDYDLRLYDPNHAEVARSEGTGHEEKITYTPEVTGKYYILVSSPNGTFSQTKTYKLKANFEAGPTPTPTSMPPEDPYEPNDTTGDAYPIVSGQEYKGYISSSDDKDYFQFEIQNLETIHITLKDMGGDSDYVLSLYYLDNTTLVRKARSVRGTGQDKEIIYYPDATGKYYILVDSPFDVFDPSDDYTLKATYGTTTPTPTLETLTVTSDGCCPITVGDLGTVAAGGTETFTDIPCGTDVTLTADDSDVCCGFTGWSGDVPSGHESDNPITIHMDSDRSVTAHCTTPGPFTLTVTSDGCCPITVGELGTVAAGGTETFTDIPCGTNVTLTADDSDTCEFESWVIDGGEPTTEKSIIVTMNDNHTAVATCTAPP